MKKPVTVVCVLIGLCLLRASSLWPHFVSNEGYWGEKEQADFSEAMRHTHELELRQTTGNRQTAANKESQEQELTAAKAHWDKQLAKLDAAKDASQRPATICLWAGIASLVAGVLAYRFLPGDAAGS